MDEPKRTSMENHVRAAARVADDGPMGWQMTGTVDEFLAEAGGFLHAEPARNTVLLTVTETMRVNGKIAEAPTTPLLGWWRRSPGGPIHGAFMHTPPFPILLTAMSEAAVIALARELAAAGRALAGVNADADNAAAFAAEWRDHTGLDARVSRKMRLFRLAEAELAWPAPMPDGAARPATVADRELLISWCDAFAAEVNEPAADQAAAVDDRLGYGGFTMWHVGGVPVSVVGVTRTVSKMMRVGPVYTPPEARGRGYAGAATVTVTRAALDSGLTDVVLFTDLANPASNALYQRSGYRPVEDRMMLTFG
jgi:GNAT superfamily N-acetyltransferase